ncbi:MAG TPA: LuxR C-terminal-related transcriptional regulator [Ktedonobacterales bacterium]|nr:LuxR C-terminal-related transcriptional regulator [Ktedonobacterales bacterium]
MPSTMRSEAWESQQSSNERRRRGSDQLRVKATRREDYHRQTGMREVNDALPGNDWECVEELTEREQEVLRLSARWLTGEEIAVALHVELCTVRKHQEHIREKLGVRRMAAAVEVARRLGIIE